MQKRGEIDYDDLLKELGFNDDEYELVYPPEDDYDKPVKLDNLIKEESSLEDQNKSSEIRVYIGRVE